MNDPKHKPYGNIMVMPGFQDSESKPLYEYEENGHIVKVMPPGYAYGVFRCEGWEIQ